jgi:hypothetical protein
MSKKLKNELLQLSIRFQTLPSLVRIRLKMQYMATNYDNVPQNIGNQPKSNVQQKVGNQPKSNVQQKVGNQPKVTVQQKVGNQPKVTVQQNIGNQPKVTVQQNIGNQPKVNVQQKVGNQPKVNVQQKVGNQPKVTVQQKVGNQSKVNVQQNIGNQPKVNVQQNIGNQPKVNVQQNIGNQPKFNVPKSNSNTLSQNNSRSSCNKLSGEQTGPVQDANGKYIVTQSCRKTPFTAISNDGFDGKYRSSCMWIALTQAIRLSRLSTQGKNSVNVPQFRDKYGFPQESIPFVINYDCYTDFEEEFEEDHKNYLQRVCNDYNLELDIYLANYTGNVGSVWIGNHAIRMKPKNYDKKKWYDRFSIVDYGNHYELIVSDTPTTHKIQTTYGVFNTSNLRNYKYVPEPEPIRKYDMFNKQSEPCVSFPDNISKQLIGMTNCHGEITNESALIAQQTKLNEYIIMLEIDRTSIMRNIELLRLKCPTNINGIVGGLINANNGNMIRLYTNMLQSISESIGDAMSIKVALNEASIVINDEM